MKVVLFIVILMCVNTSFAGAVLKHDSHVSRIVFSPDSKYLASVCKGVVYIWDIQTGKIVSELKHDFTISLMSADPECERLEPQRMPVTINAVAFGKGGEQILTSCNDHTVRVWHIGKMDIVLEAKHDSAIKAIAYSSDGGWVVRASGHKVFASNTTTNETLELLCPELVSAMRLSECGRYITATAGAAAYVWKLPTGEQLTTFKHESTIFALACNSEKRWAATSSVDIKKKDYESKTYTCKVWDILDGHPIHSLEETEGSIYSLIFSADGKRLMTASGFSAGLWDLEQGALVAQIPRSNWLHTPLTLSSKGEFTVISQWASKAASSCGGAVLWDRNTRRFVRLFKKSLVATTASIISPNDEYFAIALSDNTVKVKELSHYFELLRQGFKKNDQITIDRRPDI